MTGGPRDDEPDGFWPFGWDGTSGLPATPATPAPASSTRRGPSRAAASVLSRLRSHGSPPAGPQRSWPAVPQGARVYDVVLLLLGLVVAVLVVLTLR